MKHFVAEDIDLILSGLLFPGISGVELSMFMRQVRPEVPIVLLARTKQLPSALLKQVDGHVDGDAKAEELLNCIRQVLARKADKQEGKRA